MSFLKDGEYIALALVLIIMWITTGVYISFTHTDAASLSNKFKDDANLKKASSWSLTAEIITWTLVVLGAILLALAVAVEAFGFEILPEIEALIPGKAKLLGAALIGTILLLILLLSITGVCGIVASSNVHTSANYDPTDKKFTDGYKNATIAAVLAFVSVGVLVIGFVAYEIAKAGKKKKKAAAKAASAAQPAAVVPNLLAEVEALASKVV